MPSKNASEIAARFTRRVKSLDKTRLRIELAYQKHGLRLCDAESSYAGLFLQAVLAYEAAMEELVLGLIVRPGGVISANAGVKPRVQVRSYSHALELASGPGKPYADWIGKDALLSKANIFLFNGKPFTSLTDNDWSYVTKSKHIRNTIAHPSKSAQENFKKRVIGTTPLPSRERTVYGYLRGVSGGLTRWELYVAGLSVFVTRVAA